jgi:site-specific recombinase XerD
MTVTSDPAAPATTVWHLLPDRWQRTLRAKALSAHTERDYLYTAQRWADWVAIEHPDLEPDDVEDWHVDDFIAGIVVGTSAGNAAHHYRNLRVYFGWLVKRKEMPRGNPMDATEAPRVPEKLIPVFTDDEMDRLVEACAGRDFQSLRDKALMLFLRDTGARVAEVCGLEVDSIMLAERQAKVIGKGNKERLVGFSPDTALALLRYLKARAAFLLRTGKRTTLLWLNRFVRALGTGGVQYMLKRRGKQAGVANAHPHRFRHTFAHTWKVRNGSSEGLMATGGWASDKMPEHYGKAARASRALAEQQRLMLGSAGLA